jgi:hypothetical protein
MWGVANCIVANGHTITQIKMTLQLFDYLNDLLIEPWMHHGMSENNNHPGQMS